MWLQVTTNKGIYEAEVIGKCFEINELRAVQHMPGCCKRK